MRLDYLFDHPEDPSGSFWIRREPSGPTSLQPEQAGSVWTDQIDAEHPALTMECHRTGPSWASTCGAVAVW
jgi:hypothetical protein